MWVEPRSYNQSHHQNGTVTPLSTLPRVWIEPKSYNQSHHKNDAFTLLSTFPTYSIIRTDKSVAFINESMYTTECYEKLVMQKSRRQPQSSLTVRHFRKRKSCWHVIAISQAGIAAPTLTEMRGFGAKQEHSVHHHTYFYVLRLYFVSFHFTCSEPERQSNPVAIVGRRRR